MATKCKATLNTFKYLHTHNESKKSTQGLGLYKNATISYLQYKEIATPRHKCARFPTDTPRITPEACNKWRGPSPLPSAWATQLRRNIVAVATSWRHCVRLDRSVNRTKDLRFGSGVFIISPSIMKISDLEIFWKTYSVRPNRSSATKNTLCKNFLSPNKKFLYVNRLAYKQH